MHCFFIHIILWICFFMALLGVLGVFCVLISRFFDSIIIFFLLQLFGVGVVCVILHHI